MIQQQQAIRDVFGKYIRNLQDEICTALEQVDGAAKFKQDNWKRDGGGGGWSRVIQHGDVFEKGGVNVSEVNGLVTEAMRRQLNLDGHHFFATGLSLVIHPLNPFAPTVHANYRYFELYDEAGIVIDSWFGGGADLTPYYLYEEDAKHFHGQLKMACDNTDTALYSEFKKNCDEYFVNHHRLKEARGIGGIFFDYLRGRPESWLGLAKDCGNAFLPAYVPIVEKRKNSDYGAQQKFWQEIRRGRYVEFNLVHDRGTLFGLKTNGRTESILMSLPPTVRFEYDYQPAPGSEEDRLLQVCLHPRNWV